MSELHARIGLVEWAVVLVTLGFSATPRLGRVWRWLFRLFAVVMVLDWLEHFTVPGVVQAAWRYVWRF